MSIFSNPFFSIAGQKERITNVGKTLNAAFNPFAKVKGVTAKTGSETLNKVLSSVASHPYVSAGVVAAGVTAMAYPQVAVNVLKKLIPKSTLGKAAAIVIAPSVIGGVATAVGNNPTGAIDLALSAPSKGFNVGQDIANVAQEPSLESGIAFIKAHPYASAATLTAGLAALGFGTIAIANLVSNYTNTKSIKENTEALDKSGNPTIITDGTNIDYKDQLKLIDAQTKSQLAVIEAQTKQAKELSKLNTIPAVVAPSEPVIASEVAPAGSSIKKKAKKKKKKTKKKAKKKTRRSKKKSSKKKKKHIKRRKS